MKLLVMGILLATLVYCQGIGDARTHYLPCDYSYRQISIPTLEVQSGDSYVRTDDNGERVNCLQAPDSNDNTTYRSVFTIRLLGLQANDVIVYKAITELTNDFPEPMMVAWYVVLARSPNDILGTLVTDHKGYNISPQMHHGVVGESGVYRVTDNFPLVFLNFVVYSASGVPELQNEHVKVEVGYGQLEISIRRK